MNRRAFKTRDSALSYFVNQLDNLDRTLHEPLYSVSWSRDIRLRSGITMANESTSFIRAAFAGTGTLNQTGNMPWLSAESNDIPGVSINGERIVTPLRLLGREISFTSVELERSQLLGQSIDTQKNDALKSLYEMNTDRMVYVGDTAVGAEGLFNSTSVTAANVANGTGGSPLWVNKTPDEILADVNTLVTSTWSASGFAVCPSGLRLPPANFSYISSQKVSSAGNVSILKFLQENAISNQINGKALDIQPVKWLTGLGDSSSNRMVAYSNEERFVRFPMVPVRRETAYYQGMRFIAPYIWAYGEVEFVYPETIRYADGI